jgi:hypothetical protein
METYKRSAFELIKGIILAPFGGLFVFIVVRFFTRNPLIGWGLPVLAAAALIYMALFSEDIYFEIDDSGEFRYFKRRTLQKSLNLKSCLVGYRRKSESGILGNHYITLRILDTEGDNEEYNVDCGPLGVNRFHSMYQRMESLAKNPIETLSATDGGSEK